MKIGAVAKAAGCPMPPGAPFGGNGRSGIGRLGGRAAMREFLREKNVYVSLVRDHTQ